MQNLPSQHTLLQWLKDIVHAAEDGNEMLPTWVMQEYRVAQAEVRNKVKIEEKCGDGCDHQGPLTGCYSMSETTDDELFSFELVYVKVENTLFSVIKDWLMEEGSTFSDMFSLPVNHAGGNVSMVEGKTKGNPIVLEGVCAANFQSLLRMLYGSRGKPLTLFEEWVGALELSTRWNFVQARNTAISGIEPFLVQKGCTARITLAQQFNVASWLRTGLTDLAAQIMSSDHHISPQTLSHGDMAVDTPTIAKIFYMCLSMRDTRRLACDCLYPNAIWVSQINPHCKGCGRSWQGFLPTRENLEPKIDIVFAAAIAAAQYHD